MPKRVFQIPVADAAALEWVTRYRQEHHPKGINIKALAEEVLPKLLQLWPEATLGPFPWSTNNSCFRRRLECGLKAKRSVVWLRKHAICQLREPDSEVLPGCRLPAQRRRVHHGHHSQHRRR
jgi:hypothetical protein